MPQSAAAHPSIDDVGFNAEELGRHGGLAESGWAGGYGDWSSFVKRSAEEIQDLAGDHCGGHPCVDLIVFHTAAFIS